MLLLWFERNDKSVIIKKELIFFQALGYKVDFLFAQFADLSVLM